MSARQDNNFLEMLRDLGAKGRATPQVVELTAADVAKCEVAKSRRKQGLPPRIRSTAVIQRVARLVRG